MSSMHLGVDHWAVRSAKQTSASNVSRHLRMAALGLRTVFILSILIITLHVSLPHDPFWTVLQSPDDLIQIALGLAVCGWGIVQLFTVPKDAHAYRTWFYLGLAAVPFLLICIVGVW